MYLSPQKASQKYDIHPKTLSRLADAGVIEAIRKKHEYSGYSLPPEWVKSSPTIVIKDNKITLNWTVERYTRAKGSVAEQVKANNGLTVCAVDLNLDGDIAVCTILNSDGKVNVQELATQFVKGNARHRHRRKRLLGKDAIAKSQTNAQEVIPGFNSNLWRKLKDRERYEGERVSRRIVELARKHNAAVIVFEHLGNLIPEKGKSDLFRFSASLVEMRIPRL